MANIHKNMGVNEMVRVKETVKQVKKEIISACRTDSKTEEVI